VAAEVLKLNSPLQRFGLCGAIVLAFVLLLRLPFLDQAIQGDDIYYLAAAQHAQIDPLHPNHARYVFNGDMVDMRGHPHPPLDGWALGLLLAIFGDIREVPFHAAYILFSLLAAWGAWSLAQRFSPRPLLATLLFLATSAFVVNGTSFESDLPFLAFWLAGIALFATAVDRESRPALVLSALSFALAAMAAYQAVLAAPILAVYLWRSRKKWRAAWAVALAAPAAVLAWQLFERISSGALPATVMAGYFRTYGPQNVHDRLRNAAALITHAGWLIFPLLAIAAFGKVSRTVWIVAAGAGLGGIFLDPNPLFWASFGIGVLLLGSTGVLAWVRCNRDDLFLTSWILLFFSAALILFFAGSARYLLPIALPVAILATRLLDNPRWLWAGFALGLLVSLSLAVANYEHWDGYRQFARSMERESSQKRVWINGEWGLRYYFEADGGLAIERGQALEPGEIMVSSRLAFPIAVTTGGGVLTPIREQAITSTLPFRLIGLGAHSAYSSDALGLRPFDICRQPIDVVSAAVVVERKPGLSWLPMNAPQAGQQIVSGMYELESNAWRWMSGRAVVLLKNPGAARPLDVTFSIPGPVPARRVTVQVDGHSAAEQTYPAPGTYTLSTPPLSPPGDTVTVTISVDRTLTVPGDKRQLGIIVSELGFRR
jgi:4-amino-4-deoxy-L-arabinose transferase-like glycosyltransferase